MKLDYTYSYIVYQYINKLLILTTKNFPFFLFILYCFLLNILIELLFLY